MPYLITAKRPLDGDAYNAAVGALGVESRRAVTTLEEARTAAYRAAIAANPPMVEQPEYAGLPISDHEAIDALPEQGGTVGPLPDDTVIEVTPITHESLRVQCGPLFSSYHDDVIVTTFNELQEA